MEQKNLPTTLIPLRPRARLLSSPSQWLTERWLPLSLLTIAAIASLPYLRESLRNPLREADERCRELGYDGIRAKDYPISCSIAYHNTSGTVTILTIELGSGMAERESWAVKLLRANRDAGVPLPDISRWSEEKEKWQEAL